MSDRRMIVGHKTETNRTKIAHEQNEIVDFEERGVEK